MGVHLMAASSVGVFSIVIVVFILVVSYVWYASLISRRNKVLEALSSIDVQLRKRHDLIPNVVKLAGKFMAHEKELLSNLTELRTQAMRGYRPGDPGQIKKHLETESLLQSAMLKFFAVAENYPNLKSSETIVTAQQTFTEVEGHIAAARRFYNAAVTSLNNAVEIFPGSVFANMANVKTMPFFEIEESVRKPVDVNDLLAG